jgi:hypothetical protein
MGCPLPPLLSLPPPQATRLSAHSNNASRAPWRAVVFDSCLLSRGIRESATNCRRDCEEIFADIVMPKSMAATVCAPFGALMCEKAATELVFVACVRHALFPRSDKFPWITATNVTPITARQMSPLRRGSYLNRFGIPQNEN